MVKLSKKAKSKIGNTNALKTGASPNTVVDTLLKNNGIDARALAPKIEHYKSLVKWGEDSNAHIIAMAKIRKEYMELAYTLGGKALEIQDEIARLGVFLNKMEMDMLEEGTNPLESKEYLNAMKLKKDYIIEKNKLNLDYGKAATDFAIKRKNNPDAFDEDAMW